jgi:DNA-binding NarL/FixJ family response regulator
MNTIKAKNKIRERKVFIVDDHSIVREGLSGIINNKQDLTVCGETGGISSALQAIPDYKPDIVIVDLSLEDGSGIRLIEDLLHYNDSLLMLVLSMHDESIYAERCIKAGARGYIMKQESSDELISAIRKVLSGRIYVSDKLGDKLLNKFAANKIEVHDSPTDSLSNRELEVYQLFGQRLNKHEIAENLNISVRTIESYTEHIKKKLKLKDTREVVIHAVQDVMKI